MRLVLLGKPGCGKGTQAALLAQKFCIPAISMGQLLRVVATKKTSLGKSVKNHVDNGLLVSAKLSAALLRRRVAKKDASKGYILDGFPRELSQAKLWKEPVDFVFYIAVSDAVVIQRLGARLSCACGALYNLDHEKPRKKGICNLCKKKLVKRADDTPTVIKKRLLLYKKNTKPLLQYYKKRGILYTISGNRSPTLIFQDILARINGE